MEISKIREYAMQDFDDEREITSFENFKDIYEDVDINDYSKYIEYLLLFSKPDLASNNDMRCYRRFFRLALRLINEIQYEFKKRVGLDTYLDMWHLKYDHPNDLGEWEDTASGIYINLHVHTQITTSSYMYFNVVSYACPNQIKRKDHPAYIPFNASMDDINNYVTRMVERFNKECEKRGFENYMVK